MREDLKQNVEEYSELIGMTIESARVVLEKNGMKIRAVKQNGRGSIVTMDYRPERLNVATVNGVITEILKLG